MPTSLNKYLDPAALDETVVNIRQIAEALEEEMQDLPYARPDGLYPDMTVGAVIGADETAQWATRESTGSGAATVRSVQGAAVAWNQLVSVSEKSIANIERNSYASSHLQIANPISIIAGHIYLGCGNFTLLGDANGAFIYLTSTASQGSLVSYATPDGRRIFTASANVSATLELRVTAASYPATFGCNVENVQLFDLTQMFGAGNEPATVAEFETMYPESYYPYSAPTLKPVRIAGIASTDANGDALDGVEWTAQTLRAAGSVRDELTADELVTRVGVVDLGTLTWYASSVAGIFSATVEGMAINATAQGRLDGLACASYPIDTVTNVDANMNDKTMKRNNGLVYVRDNSYTTAAEFKAAMNGVLLFYELATPTTTPISPALPMTYRVQQGGTESIVVPDGESSAAPVLTVAEPVNAGDEFARIWAAIQSLGYTRNTAQLSRPVSLTDIGSIDEVQGNTTEIETTKEVKE